MRQQRGRRVRGQRFVQLTHNWQMTIGNGVIAALPGLSPKQILTGWLKGRQRGVDRDRQGQTGNSCCQAVADVLFTGCQH